MPETGKIPLSREEAGILDPGQYYEKVVF